MSSHCESTPRSLGISFCQSLSSLFNSALSLVAVLGSASDAAFGSVVVELSAELGCHRLRYFRLAPASDWILALGEFLAEGRELRVAEVE